MLVVKIATLLMSILDLSLDFLETLGDSYPTLRKIQPTSIDESIEIGIATIFGLYLGLCYLTSTTYDGYKLFSSWSLGFIQYLFTGLTAKLKSYALVLDLSSFDNQSICKNENTKRNKFKRNSKDHVFNKSSTHINTHGVFRDIHSLCSPAFKPCTIDLKKKHTTSAPDSIITMKDKCVLVTHLISSAPLRLFTSIYDSLKKLSPSNEYNVNENIKVLRKALARQHRRKKKKLRYSFQQTHINSIFNLQSQQDILLHTDESYDNVNKSRRKLWKLQYNQLINFNASLNKKNCFLFDSDSFPVVFDSGASSTSTDTKDDFIPGTFVAIEGVSVSGIASGLEVKGYGSVNWNFYTIKGEVISLKIDKVLYIPGLPTRLISPQQICQQYGGSSNFTLDINSARLNIHNNIINIPYDYSSNLPITCTESNINKYIKAYNLHNHELDNLTKQQRQLLRWHRILGHMGFHKIQAIARQGLLPKDITTCPIPICGSCQIGKQKRAPVSKNGGGSSLKKDQIAPGDLIHSDQFSSPQPGLVPQSSGKLTTKSFYYGTIYVDSASDFVYCALQESKEAKETVDGKHKFESFCRTHDVSVKGYRADNHIYNSNLFRQSCSASGQGLSFSGVNAHHQNGVAERKIGHITNLARTMLFHAMLSWSTHVTTHLWPFAIKHAIDLHNATPNNSGLSPMELFTGLKSSFDFSKFHTFGSPAYVLEPTLQSGHKIPRWNPRSKLGVYLGKSAEHAGNVSLILDPSTSYVSPQFHVVHDDDFTSVLRKRVDILPPDWDKLFKYYDKTNDDDLINTPLTATMINEGDKIVKVKVRFDHDESVIRPSDDPLATANVSEDNSSLEHNEISVDLEKELRNTLNNEYQDEIESSTSAPIQSQEQELITTRSGRRIHKPVKYVNFTVLLLGLITSQFFDEKNLLINQHKQISFFKAQLDYDREINKLPDGSNNAFQPFAYHADQSNNDTLYYGQAMKAEDADDFKAAMNKEVKDLYEADVFDIIPIEDKPKDRKLIKFIWSFKRKRSLIGVLIKHKARLCVHGGMQEKGVDYFNTFAPVVNWNTVRFLLTLSIQNGWCARHVDYVLAFSQASCDTDIYLSLPSGFHVKDGNQDKGYCIKLKKNLYGACQASANWFVMLRDGLLARDYTQSEVDPCLFYKKDSIIVTYVDDCIIFAKDHDKVKQIISSLEDNFKLADEGDLSAYLGIDITKSNNETWTLSQPFLIDRIINALNLENDSKVHDTPATEILTSDKNGEPFAESWHYRSVQGMLTYLAGSTRPDIQFAVHQTSRFCNDPRASHGKAIKRIGRYLKRTRDKGLIFSPNKDNGFEDWADADFAGGWNLKDSGCLRSVLSRSGFIIKYASCPIAWSSKLQSEIALSTTEAEYISLSQSLRDLIPLHNIFDELSKVDFIKRDKRISKTYSTVYEDNRGALELAREPKFRPRTKHIATKYHHFRNAVAKGQIRIFPIDTKDQQADIFTKPLPKPQFEKLRKLIMGW